MTHDVLDTAEVAILLRCAPTTVQERARRGDLPGLKIGDDWIFPRDALLKKLNELALEEAANRRRPGVPHAVALPITSSGTARRRALPVLPTA